MEKVESIAQAIAFAFFPFAEEILYCPPAFKNDRTLPRNTQSTVIRPLSFPGEERAWWKSKGPDCCAVRIMQDFLIKEEWLTILVAIPIHCTFSALFTEQQVEDAGSSSCLFQQRLHRLYIYSKLQNEGLDKVMDKVILFPWWWRKVSACLGFGLTLH